MKFRRIALAFLLTLLLFIASRLTGPNFRYRVTVQRGDVTLSHKAIRTSEGNGPARVTVDVKDPSHHVRALLLEGGVKPGPLNECRMPSTIQTVDAGNRVYHYEIPFHPWLTRYCYQWAAVMHDGTMVRLTRDGKPLEVRFRGNVPTFWMVLHIGGMFIGFGLIILVGLTALRLIRGLPVDLPLLPLGWSGWGSVIVGGIPVGIVINWYAFRVFWEAWPFRCGCDR